MEQEQMKKAVGYKAAEFIREGMTVGLGTGSTVFYFIEKLIERVKQGLTIRAVSSSSRSLDQASKGGIPLCDINLIPHIDITVDGADEIDSEKRMIKGGGGALLREKILASMSKEMIVVIDESKISHQLGSKKLPVEIVPFASQITLRKVQRIQKKANIRKTDNGSIFVTDNGNFIIDIFFDELLHEPEILHSLLKQIPGVVETGFFFHLAGRVIVGFKDGQVVVRP
jgi:ribose 5-phosphate isomerase A